MSDTESLDGIFYNSIEYILENSKDKYFGAGLSKIVKKQKVETNLLLNRLIELGWNPNYIKKTFKNMNDNLIQGWPENLLIEHIFKQIIQQTGFQNSLEDSFIGIGLEEDVAKLLADVLNPLLDSSYSYEQVLEVGIDYLLGVYNPITSPTTSFLIKPQIINTWFIYKKYKELNIYNIQIDDNIKLDRAVNNALAVLQLNNNDIKLYFHSTSWKGSDSIMKRINRQMGRYCLDFGIFPGFYLSDTCNESVDWAIKNMKRWYNEAAIMIFAIPTIYPKSIKYKELTKDEWVQVVKESRECRQRDVEIELIHKYDLLYGDMLYNVNQVKNGTEFPKTHSPPKKQLVGRTDKAEKFLHKCLVGCIYIQKH
jgi:hypothetical protein